jgi:hypothetical protein
VKLSLTDAFLPMFAQCLHFGGVRRIGVRIGNSGILPVQREKAVARGLCRNAPGNLTQTAQATTDTRRAVMLSRIVAAICLLWAQVFVAVDRQSHSVSDTLYGVFPFVSCSFLPLDWIAHQCGSPLMSRDP